ncbi:MAG TPA: hypothetical protein VE988_12710 [Gemmataceae bacterium]|nr:hypothetical protein [Gemmataceae bacterium]
MKRLLLALVIVSALVASGVGYYLWGKYTRMETGAYALLHITSGRPLVLTPGHFDKEEFDGFQKTQVAMVKSRLVLNSALREPKVAALAVVREQTDPVAWLEKKLIVDFPDAPEIMRIAMIGEVTDAVVIVNAVMGSYLKESVNKEHRVRHDRLAKFNGIGVNIGVLEIEQQAPERISVVQDAIAMKKAVNH